MDADRGEDMPDTIHMQSNISLLLAGRVIHEGDQLILQVFGGEIEGVARHSRTGWYLLTAAQVPIRLSAGLVARWKHQGAVPIRENASKISPK